MRHTKIVSIRHKLLVSFVLVSLASSLLITSMIFVYLKNILLDEIENKLKSQAMTVMHQIDTTLFERIENIVTWSELDVMQELRFRDVDKRLSNFLSRLHNGYEDVYQLLYVTDQNRQIISSSDPALIGGYQAIDHDWQEAAYKDNTLKTLLLNSSSERLYVSVPVPNTFQTGSLGSFYVGLDWKQISSLLDGPLPISYILGTSYLLLVDNNGRIIAKSAEFAKDFADLNQLPVAWHSSAGETGIKNLSVQFMGNQEVLIAYAHAQGFRGFKGLGWNVLIIQPKNIALAPIWTLWQAIAIFLLFTILLSIMVSIWLAHNIARPISELADFTRDFNAGKQRIPPILKTSREITELSWQFAEMINNLEKSRQDTVRAAKLAVIGEMAASMAHEVRTPLGILKSSAQILQRETGLTDIGYELTEFILDETSRLNNLISTLLECSQPRKTQFIQHDIQQIIEYTLGLVSTQLEAQQILFKSQFVSAHPVIACDKEQMIQVLLNLILNAAQHTPSGGQIVLRTADQAEYLEITVFDSGHGIADANKKRIFEPFFTQREKGIGLGLTVVQQLVLAHHGRIFVTDSSLGGACFHVLLPIKNHQEEICP